MTVEKGYEETIRSIVSGQRRVTSRWQEFFDAAAGDFDARVEQAFRSSGCVPTRAQFDRARASFAEPAAPAPAPEPVVAEEPKPRKPKAADKEEGDAE